MAFTILSANVHNAFNETFYFVYRPFFIITTIIPICCYSYVRLIFIYVKVNRYSGILYGGNDK